MTYGIYVRVSTDEQVKHGTSLKEQIRKCREKALKLGASEINEYVDDGITGTTMERPQLKKLVADAERGILEAVVVLDPDRLARNLTHLLIVVDTLQQTNVTLHFVDFQAEMGPDGRLLFAVRGAIAEFEAHHIKQRMKSGKEAKAKQNKMASGTAIYGYSYDRHTKAWSLNPEQASTVQMIFEWAKTIGTRRIADKLNSMGLLTLYGRLWRSSTVLRMLRNPTYLGKLPQMNGMGHVEMPPLVGQETFEEVQARLDARQYNHDSHHSYMLSGMMRCALCGGAVTGGYGRQRATTGEYVHYYGCTGKLKKPRCKSHFYRTDEIEPLIWEKVVEFLRSPEEFIQAAKELAASKQERPIFLDVETLRGSLERLDGEYAKLLRAYRKDLISEADLDAQRREIEAEKKVLADQLAKAETEERFVYARGKELMTIIETIRGLSNDIETITDPSERKNVLKALKTRIIMGVDGTAEVRFGMLGDS